MWCQVQAKSSIYGQGCPLVRSKHAMCSGNDGCIYLYGGKSLLNQTLKDLWRFDTKENQWEQMILITRINDDNNNNNQNHNDTFPSTTTTTTTTNQICQTCRSLNNNNHLSSIEESSSSTNNTIIGTEITNLNDSPPPLQEHTIIGYKNKLYIFGGEIGYSSDETPLWIFDLDKLIWKKYSVKDSINHSMISRPLGRRGHSAVIYKNIMCIYGGYQDIKGSTSEIWTYNLDTEEWYLEGINFKKDSSPLPRHGHSAIVYKDSMYIYGGMSNLNVRGDFWSWNFKTKEWNRVKTNRNNPGVLSFHSAIVVLDSMFIFGGERSNGNNTNELWRYRFANQSWEHIEIKGIAPSCRTRHVAIANPYLKELESNSSSIEWQQSSSKRQPSMIKQNQLTETTSIINKNNNNNNKKSKRQRNNYFLENLKNQSKQNQLNNKSTKDTNIKSISMCFNQVDDSTTAAIVVPKSSNSKNNSEIKPSPNVNDDVDVLNQENNDPNPNTSSNNENNRQQTNSTTVKMRPRRPLLQKQRPYSDFYGDTNVLLQQQQNKDDFDELNDFQFKRRSVQESMSYYSLCFSTPPSHLQKKSKSKFISTLSPNDNDNNNNNELIQNLILNGGCNGVNEPEEDYNLKDYQFIDHQSSEEVQPQQQQQYPRSPPPSWKTIFEDKISTMSDNPHQNNNDEDKVDNNNQFVVKRRENFISKRRLRKSDLGLLDFSSLVLSDDFTANNNINTTTMKNGYNGYSLNLDISPDFEKELKFSNNSTPSNQLNSISTNNTTNTNDDNYEFENIEMQHLDMLEDYLEPEEMLEIVQESANYGENIHLSSSLNIKSIPRTPGRRRKIFKNKNDSNEIKSQQPPPQPQSSSSAASVSNSSSGYQSLILSGDSSNLNSFDIISNQSISNSSSFADQNQQSSSRKKDNLNFDPISVQKLVSKLIGGTSTDSNQTTEYIELKHPSNLQKINNQITAMASTTTNTTNTTRTNHLQRLSHWEPNIKEVIEEVNTIPCSPTTHLQQQQQHDPLSFSLTDDDDDDDHDDLQDLNDEDFLNDLNDLNDYDNDDDEAVDDTISEEIHQNDLNFQESSLLRNDPRHHSLSSKKNKKNYYENQQKKKNRKHPIFCMYVFGGKEDCITGVLNKQSMTIWKYYT